MNIIAILAIAFSIIGISPLNTTINFNSYSTPVSIILAALAIISFDTVLHFIWLKTPQYYNNHKHFVDRYKLIKRTISDLNNTTIINVYGENGIGVTNTLQFLADLINKKASLFRRIKYSGLINAVFRFNRKSRYYNVSRIKSIEDLCKLVSDSIAISSNISYNIPNLSVILCRKKARYILIFDEIKTRDQMTIIEDFCIQLSQHSPKTSYIIGTHLKNLSYQIKYDYIEILRFGPNELTILAKVHNIKLKEHEKVELLELSNGIPMFAYLLIRYYDSIEGLKKTDLINYLSNIIIPSLSKEEFDILESICILSITNSSIDLKKFSFLLGSSSKITIESLEKKGLVNVYSDNNLVVNRLVLEQLNRSIPVSNTKCNKLYYKYTALNDEDRAILYLTLSRCGNSKINIISEYINRKISLGDNIALSFFVEPIIKYKVDIKNIYPSLYLKLVYVCVYIFDIEGKYIEAKRILDDLIVDGELLQRIDEIESELDYKFYFLWADTEHLLNNYKEAIDIVDSLIVKTTISNPQRLPQLLWMKAHCLRHQWSYPETAKEYYIKCFNESIKQNSNEYIIRSLHGLICISFIQNDLEFNFEEAFSKLYDIYNDNPNKWEQYKYMTLKYEGVFMSVCNKYSTAEKYLCDALNGFIKIKKRNIYDVYFEFGELYRLQGYYNKSIEYYEKCIEFSISNSDYNLQSLSEIGKIISEFYSGKNNNYKENLLNISKNARMKDLNLNYQYAKYIASNLAKEDISKFKLFNP